MTPSPTRPTASRPAPRRARLLAASALCGVATMLATPVLSQTLPGIPGAGSITVSSGGSQPVITAPGATELDIDLNASRTVINWASLHLSSADQMTFHFDAASDLVLNKTTSQIAIDSGATVSGLVGASAGGNIWFYSPQGVIVSPGANMSAGGFLFSRGTGINDVSFVDAADPVANLRAATDALIRMSAVSTATAASIDAAGNVLLSQSSGGLSVQTAEGATVSVSTTSGSITASEIISTSGAALVTSGGPGATVTQITGATGVTVSSNSNTSVGSATTSTSGDILITSGGSASLTVANSARDVTLSAPQVFVSTVDAGRDVFITGTTLAFVTNRIFAGDDIEITANGDVTASGAYLKSTGVGASDDAHILLRSTAGLVNAANTLLTEGTGAQAGDITIDAATTANLGAANATRDIRVSGTSVTLVNGTAARDVLLTATTGAATVTTAATAGDDVIINANGDVLAGGATLKGTGAGHVDPPGSFGGSYVYAASATGAVNVGSAVTEGTGTAAGDVVLSAITTATLGSGSATRDLNVIGASASLTTGQAERDLFISATTGNATVTTYAIAGDDLEITTTSGNVLASNANLWGGFSGGSDDGHVLVRSTSGSVSVLSAESRGGGAVAGDVTIQAGTTATVAGASATRNLAITGAGSFDLSGLYGANGTASFTSTAGAITESGGSIAATTLTLNGATGVSLNQINNVINLGASSSGTGSFTYRDVNNVNLNGNIVSGADVTLISDNGAINQSAGTISGDVLNLQAATGTSLTQENTVNSLGLLTNNTSGTLVFRDADGFDITDNINSAGGVSLFSTNGDITHSAGVLHAGGSFALDSGGLLDVGDIDAGASVSVTAAGNITLASATAGEDINIMSAGGSAVLRKAVLTGAGANDDLSLVAAGDAILGADDHLTITADNVFSRTGGGTGTATVRAIGGDALIHLATSAGFTQVEGEDVDVTIETGPAAFDAVTATLDDVYIEALDGALTVGSAWAATGDVELFNAGGDLTITGSAHASGLVHVETDGLLDGSLASLISSDGDIEMIGAGVNLSHLQAGGMIEVTAFDTNAYVELASAGQTVLMAALNGDATLRGAQGPDGVIMLAYGDATFGADDRNSITADNYVMTNPSCGCGTDGLQVTSINGDARVNINYASNGIELVGSSIGGNVDVVLTSGDLKIAEVAGYNITLNATDGTLEVGHVVSAGGDYTVTAHDFVGANTLTPDLFNGVINDVTITDTLGGLDLGTLALHADHWLTIEAKDGSAWAPITGAAQLSAGSGLNDGRVTVKGQGVALDSVISDGLVSLDGGTGLVDVATSVDVWGNYSLLGGDFANAALTPTGARAGTWLLRDQAGGFDFTGQTLRYGGGFLLVVDGVVNGGDITVDTGNIFAQVDSGHLGTLTAPMQVAVNGATGGIDVDAINAGTLARVRALNGGAARLGAATLTGAGANQVSVQSANGNAILGAATLGAITAANFVTSAGTGSTIEVTGANGRADVHLNRITGARMATVSGPLGVSVKVANGALQLGDVTSTSGQIRIDGQSLTLNGSIRSGATGDAIILASDGVLTNARGADAVVATNPSARWLIYTQALGAPLGSTTGNSFNGLAGKNWYGSPYDFSTRTFGTGPGAGNRFVYAYRPALTVTADAQSKIFGQGDPALTYRITSGTLLGGDAFTGGLTREAGDTPGAYAITQGTLAQDMNYDVTFTGATFTIQQVPSNDQGGVPALKALNQSPDFNLNWDPEADLTAEGQDALSGSTGAVTVGTPVASLR